MKFIKPSEWITPAANRADIGDVSPASAHIKTGAQVLTYPIAAAVSGIGALVARVKAKSK